MSGISERQAPPAPVDAQAVALYLRVLGGDLGAAHLWFDEHVLDRYRGQAGWRVIRTNTVGRLRSPEGWSLDFGIAAGDAVLHPVPKSSANACRHPSGSTGRSIWLCRQPAATFSRCASRRALASTMASCATGRRRSRRNHQASIAAET
jgi:hypothetical protein